MAEHGSSGIWVVEPHGPFRHGMIQHRKLQLPEELANGFREWIERYWMALDAQAEFDVQAFNEDGLRLARALKRHVGPETRVLFACEGADGHLGEEQELE